MQLVSQLGGRIILHTSADECGRSACCSTELPSLARQQLHIVNLQRPTYYIKFKFFLHNAQPQTMVYHSSSSNCRPEVCFKMQESKTDLKTCMDLAS